MVFSKIHDKPLTAVTMDELNTTLFEHAFFRFMDGGREGLRGAAHDVVDNHHAWITAKNAFGSRIKIDVRRTDAYVELTNEAVRLLVNGLIMAGSAGVRDAISKIYLRTLDTIIETNIP